MSRKCGCAEVKNIFSNIPDSLPEELIEGLAGKGAVRIERIVSRGQASPPGFWYDQERSEFVMVLKGRAKVALAGKEELVILGPGDYIDIPAHVKHRVEWTDPEQDTIWLAVHYGL